MIDSCASLKEEKEVRSKIEERDYALVVVLLFNAMAWTLSGFLCILVVVVVVTWFVAGLVANVDHVCVWAGRRKKRKTNRPVAVNAPNFQHFQSAHRKIETSQSKEQRESLQFATFNVSWKHSSTTIQLRGSPLLEILLQIRKGV